MRKKLYLANPYGFSKQTKTLLHQFIEIFNDLNVEVYEPFERAKPLIEQEKEWATYLFRDGSMIGLNDTILKEYIEWIGTKRMRALGLNSPFSVSKLNPLPWTEKWISGGNVQVAPQETEISSYVVGGVKQDVDDTTLKGLSL